MTNFKKNEKRSAQLPVEPSSGNVFVELGLPNPDLALTKATLVQQIRDLIAQRHMSQAGAAELLGIDQPKVSALLRGQVEGYSLDRLFRFLNALGQRIEICIHPGDKRARGAGGGIRVTQGSKPLRKRAV